MKISSTKSHEETLRIDFIFVILCVALWMIFRHVHDLHATILHLLGFDHEKLTYRFQGRDFRLTDVHGLVVDKLLA